MAFYRITGLRLELCETWEILHARIEKACGFIPNSLSPDGISVRRVSLDARNKSDIHYVLTIDFEYKGKLPGKAKKKLTSAPDLSLPEVIPGTEKLVGHPVIVGFGPCGIFAALRLAEAGYAPIVIERGRSMDERVTDVNAFWEKGILDPESNVLFGEGGAGTFSDGKLTTGIKDPHIHQILKDFVAAGAPEDILWQQKPHIGTDILRKVVVNLRRRIEAAGGQVCFNTCMTALEIEDDRLVGVKIKDDQGERTIDANAVIMATGHSARDTFRMCEQKKVPMAQKPFSIGVRMTHPQALIDQAQYGDVQGLPPATYKLAYHTEKGRGVYSFCMCPGGEVITCTTQEGMLCVNGMSNRNRDSGTANAGILVDVRTSDFPGDNVLSGVDFQEIWERKAFKAGGSNMQPPTCTWADLRDHTEAAQPVMDSLPDFAIEALREAIPVFGKKIRGFDHDDAGIIAVETRSSSPVRILRDKEGQSEIKGLYPGGEGAGYAGGIMSAACDGMKLAEQIMRRFDVFEKASE